MDTPRIRSFYQRRRSGSELQLGATRWRQVTIAPADPWMDDLLDLLDGSRSVGQAAREVGVAVEDAEAVVDALRATGAVEDQPIDEDGRYARHLLYYSMFADDPAAVQDRLGGSTVALLGVGGLGSVVATQLAMAGVGRLILVDPDVVELSNLTRQFLYRESDVGRGKAALAADRLRQLNRGTDFVPVAETVSADSAGTEAAIAAADLVVLTADKPLSLSDEVDGLCQAAGRPWLRAGYAETVGIVGPLVVPGRTGCLACPAEAGEPWRPVAHFQTPSFGPLNGLVGSLAATDVLRYLGRFARPASLGTRLVVDSVTLDVERVPYRKRRHCARCGGRR